ncbi:DUF6452 family protein [Maribacter antarcticus]|uniref:DUF6452 family protein n=1 Tax=Maribacter antarcticus TaxID=505250 RepID=UPI00047C0B89|nr:DUF6452 family protein [Maribacter antarcticus]
MKNFGFSILIFLYLLTVASCEKDDICVEGNTPLMVIEFFDISNRDDLKNVTTLRVVGEGQTVTVNTVTDRTNLNKIIIPLKTAADTTGFLLIANSASNDDGLEIGNIDTVSFNYARLEDFKSRACGFIINYEELNGVFQTDTDNWIQDIEIMRTEIINSDSTHVKIFH